MNKKSTDIKKFNENALKSTKIKYAIIAAAAVLAIVVGLIIYFNYSKSYVAKVGNSRISTAEYKFFLSQTKDTMLAEAAESDPNTDPNTFWSTKIDGENALELAKKKALETAREMKIQVIKAKEQDIKLTSDQLKSLDDWIDSLISYYGNRIKADQAAKDTYGISLNELKGIYKQIILATEFAQKEIEGMNVTEDKIEEYYNTYPEIFKDTEFRKDAEEAVWARHILINSTSDMSEEEQNNAKKKAEDILAKIKNGEDFIALAKENSQDSGSASYGGDYVFGKGRMVKEFEDAAFSLSAGQVSDLIKTDYGYHIIKVEEKIAEGQVVSLKCAKEYREFGVVAVENYLYDKKIEEWKNDPKYEIVKNTGVYNSIT